MLERQTLMIYLPIQSNPEFRAELERFAKMGDITRVLATKAAVGEIPPPPSCLLMSGMMNNAITIGAQWMISI